MKQIRKTLVVLVLVIAGVAFSQQAKDESKKGPAAKNSECCAKMKTKAGGKMSCCTSDSTCVKDGKSSSGKH